MAFNGKLLFLDRIFDAIVQIKDKRTAVSINFVLSCEVRFPFAGSVASIELTFGVFNQN